MTQPHYADEAVTLWHGDAIKVMRTMPAASVDAVVCDPPYALPGGFMGKSWDAFASPAAFAEFSRTWAVECLRVLKPGGHLLAFGGSRTHHRLICGVEDAGFEIRDTITWLYGSGFPKSLDVSKAIHAYQTLGGSSRTQGRRAALGDDYRAHEGVGSAGRLGSTTTATTAGGSAPVPAEPTSDARRWQGWGTALKPASEPTVVARKPLAGTVAQTVQAYGTGALNIDGCRVAASGRPLIESRSEASVATFGDGLNGSRAVGTTDEGRWPANVVLSHVMVWNGGDACSGPDGCVPGCPVAELDRQSGTGGSGGGVVKVSSGRKSGVGTWNRSDQGMHAPGRENVGVGDSGGASRYFPTFRYEAKAPTSERPRIGGKGSATAANRCALCGKQDLSGSRCTCPEPQWIPRNGSEVVSHPTVKPLDLMRWLVRLVTPPGGLVLDPFAGSGTTGEACVLEGFRCHLIELEATHLPLIVKRLAKPMQLGLFGTEA